jgi:hypothetical protein
METLNVSEQQAEQTSGETGSLNAEPALSLSSDTPSAPVAASVQGSVQPSATETAAVASPDLVPAQGAVAEANAPKSEAATPESPKADAPKAEAPKAEVPKAEAPKVEAPKAEAPKAEAPKAEAPKAEAPKVEAPTVEAPKAEAPKAEAPKAEAPKADAPHSPGKVMIMSAGERGWANDHNAGPEVESEQDQGMFGQRRLAALAAVVTLAVLAGAVGGALATAGYSHFVVADNATSSGPSALEVSVARIDADMLVLKASIEHTSKMGMSQFNKTSDRLDRVEKAQAEPAAKLAKLSEAVDKLRAPPPAAAVPVAAAPIAAKEVTGSITPPATTAPAAAAPAAPAKPEVARLPTVDGWVLRDVANGGALIEGRQGLYEVFAGDPIPGLGRVDAIRRQDGRWVVVTSKGLIVAR